jgi:carboxymethylenebutenolidase
LRPFGEQLLLQRCELFRVLRLGLLGSGLALLEPGRRARVELAQVDRAGRRAQEAADALGHSRAECPVMVLTREYVDIPVDGRAMRTFVAAPRAGGPHPGVVFYTDIFQLTEPSLRWAIRLAGLRLPRRGARDLPPDRAGRDRARVRRRGQGARARATPTRPRWPTSTPTSTPRSHGSGERASSIGAAGHCTGGHLAFRAAFRPQVRATACWYATGLHDGKLGKDPDAGSLARAGEIEGELLAVWGTTDPHTPTAGRETIKAGLDPLATRLTWREYDAEHAFGRDVGDRYDPQVTDEAFAETITLFRARARCRHPTRRSTSARARAAARTSPPSRWTRATGVSSSAAPNDYCGVYNATDADGEPDSRRADLARLLPLRERRDELRQLPRAGLPGRQLAVRALSQSIRTASAGDPVIAWDARAARSSAPRAPTTRPARRRPSATSGSPPTTTRRPGGARQRRQALRGRPSSPSGSSAPNLLGKFNDKTAIEADHNSDGRCDNDVYFAWSRFTGNRGGGGSTSPLDRPRVDVQPPVKVSQTISDVQFADIAVTGNSNVYVVFRSFESGAAGGRRDLLRRSTDCGATFARPRSADVHPLRRAGRERSEEAPAQSSPDDPAGEEEPTRRATRATAATSTRTASRATRSSAATRRSA